MYPVVFFDALRVKIRDEATVRSKAVYLTLAVLPDGSRDILGIWIEQTEGAKFWMKVFTDLRTRGCQNLVIAVTDALRHERPQGLGKPKNVVSHSAHTHQSFVRRGKATPHTQNF